LPLFRNYGRIIITLLANFLPMNRIKTFLSAALLLLIISLQNNKADAQAVAVIPHINSGIVVDGLTDDLWNLLEDHPITYQIDGSKYPSTSDCSGSFKAFWNKDTLYVMIFALDDTLYTRDNTVYLNDGFEIYLNVDHTKDTLYTENCYQFRFTPGSHAITGRWGLNVWTPPTVDFAIHINAGSGRTIEAVFPLADLGNESPVAEGDSMGFEIEILDNDGYGREHVMSWNNNLHMAYYDPTHMGTIIYTENTITSFKNPEVSNISVYPNPASDHVLVQSPKEFSEVAIYSAQGQRMYEKTGLSATHFSLDVNSFKAGIYILNVKMKDGTYVKYKLVKTGQE
jgi:hypothetical protein